MSRRDRGVVAVYQVCRQVRSQMPPHCILHHKYTNTQMLKYTNTQSGLQTGEVALHTAETLQCNILDTHGIITFFCAWVVKNRGFVSAQSAALEFRITLSFQILE